MDYPKSVLTILTMAAGLMIAAPNWTFLRAASGQELVLSGRFLFESGGAGAPAVRLQCPGFQRETLATATGRFTFRVPRLGESGLPSHPGLPHRRDEDGPFANYRPGDLLECTLEARDRAVVLSRFEIAIPLRSNFFDLGDLELPVAANRIHDTRPVISWRSLGAPDDALDACDQVKKELNRNRPDLDRADQLLQSTLRLHPDLPEAWELLGVVEGAKGHIGAARSAFEKALKLDDTSYETYTFLAQLDMQERKWHQALEDCNSALEIEPDFLRAHYLRAFAAYNLGEFGTARTASRRIHASGGNDRFADLAVVEALLLEQEGKTAQASSILRTFLRQHPDYANRSDLEARLKSWEASPAARSPKSPN